MSNSQLPCVYVVDDDEAIRESLKTLIAGAGYSVQCFASAETFLERVDLWVPACLLIDVHLKGMNGIELQGRLVRGQSKMSVIAMSGYDEIDIAVQAMRLGAADFIRKPFQAEDLLERLVTTTAAVAHVEASRAAARRNAALLATLTVREVEVLSKLLEGKPNKVVARELHVSPRTVETHRVHIMEKLGVDSLAHLIRLWLSAQYAQTIAGADPSVP